MKLLYFLVVLYTAAAMPDRSFKKQWIEFKDTYKKAYTDEEDAKRFDVFIKNLERVDQHNQLYDKGAVTFTLKINEFSDWYEYEFERLMPSRIDEDFIESTNTNLFQEEDEEEIPNSFDWREKGAVTYVKSQKSCGSCWAFAVTGSIESHSFIKHKKEVVLSEQNIMDCGTKKGGCHGGSIDSGYKFIINNGGIDTEKNYPYEAKPGKCRFSNKTVGAKLTGYKAVPKSEDALRKTIATVGPVAIYINSHLPSFHHYHTGVYYDPECDKHGVTHAMLVVGYGTENQTGYFLLKNSWGENWGEHGFIKVAATNHGHCNLTSHMVYPIVA